MLRLDLGAVATPVVVVVDAAVIRAVFLDRRMESGHLGHVGRIYSTPSPGVPPRREGGWRRAPGGLAASDRRTVAHPLPDRPVAAPRSYSSPRGPKATGKWRARSKQPSDHTCQGRPGVTDGTRLDAQRCSRSVRQRSHDRGRRSQGRERLSHGRGRRWQDPLPSELDPRRRERDGRAYARPIGTAGRFPNQTRQMYDLRLERAGMAQRRPRTRGGKPTARGRAAQSNIGKVRGAP